MNCLLFSLLAFAFTQPGLTVEATSFEEFPIVLSIERTNLTASVSHDTRMVEVFKVWVANESEKAIIAVVLKKLCAPQGTAVVKEQIEACGNKESYYYHGSEGSEPIAPGEVRSIPYALITRHPEGTHYTVIPLSVLFEDGTSAGMREPYANKYLQSILPTVRHYQSNPEAARMISPSRKERIEKLKNIAGAIITESRHLENEAIGLPHRKQDQ